MNKILILLWKNYLVLKFHWFATLCEIMLPVIMFFLLATTQEKDAGLDSIPGMNATDLSAWIPTYDPQGSEDEKTYQFFYGPQTNFTTAMMANLKHYIEFLTTNQLTINIEPVSNNTELEYRYSTVSAKKKKNMFGLIFSDLGDSDEVPRTLTYTLRINGTLNEVDPRDFPMPKPDYGIFFIHSGLQFLQTSIDLIYIGLMTKDLSLDVDKNTKNTYDQWFLKHHYNISFFPYSAFKAERPTVGLERMSGMFALVLTYSIFILCTSIMHGVVGEKQSGITELLKLMGLNRVMIWLGWMLRNLMLYSVTISLVVIIMKISLTGNAKTLQYSDPLLVWLFMMEFIVAQTCCLFLISTFCEKPMVATGVGVFVWVGSEVLAEQIRPEVLFELKMALSLLPNVAARFGCLAIARLEQKERGVQWDNLFEHGSETDVTLGSTMCMLLVDSVIHAVLAWYIEAIRPGPYGIPKVWYFPAKRRKVWDVHRVGSVPSVGELPENFEMPSPTLRVSIEISNLRKVYDQGGVVAVDGVTIEIYENQITALLGHNGAGKTTTMSIITGMCPASSGLVKIHGYDIRHGMREIRRSMGLCPQHDLFFVDLTVLQHLMLFGMIKGLSYREAKRRSLELLDKFGMRECKNMLCEHLSGGMRRKLSLGIALIGDPKVIVLDEPTSGLDPAARRNVWDMLLALRGSKTIIITTHIMEEADVLGDWTAIMNHGKVKCYGTPMYLKRRYGGGFKLTVVSTRDVDRQLAVLVTEAVPGATFLGRVGAEMSFNLPENKKASFPAMFDAIEKNRKAMDVTSMGLTLTTIEDVFLTVGGMAETGTPKASFVLRQVPSLPLGYANEKRPVILGMKRLHGFFVKKSICMFRKWRFFIAMSILLILSMIATVYVTLATSAVRGIVPIDVTLGFYRGRVVTFQTTTEEASVQLAKKYERVVIRSGSTPREVPPTKNMLEDFLSISEATLNNYSDRIVVGAQLAIADRAIYFNAIPYYALPVAVNVIDNAFLMDAGCPTCPESSIQTYIYPLRASKANTRLDMATAVLFWSILFPIMMLCLMGGFIGYPLTDRASGAKRVQLMTGASSISYWVSCFLVDMFIYVLICSLLIGCIPFFDSRGYYNTVREVPALVMVFCLYGVSMLPYVYCVSLAVDDEGKGFTLLILINITITTLVPMVLAIMSMFQQKEVSDLVNLATNLLLIAPHYCLVKSLESFSKIALLNNYCSTLDEVYVTNLCAQNSMDECCMPEKRYIDHFQYHFEYNTLELGYGKPMTSMVLDAIFYSFLILLRESEFLPYVLAKVAAVFCPLRLGKDEISEEVREQMLDIARDSFDQSRYALVADNLVKRYGVKRAPAVKGVSFTVESAQCFGLLGTNGAGKTTTFRIMTGAVRPTSGRSFIDGNALTKDRGQYLADLGYCPQDNAFNDVLTAKQMLQLYARLRGIPSRYMNNAVAELVNTVGLSGYENFQSGTYSGGNKRKLMIALALIGEPKVVFLDEPSSGVDPGARRKIWKVLLRVQRTGKCLVMTSHSMDECEALCDTLAIMVAGRFMALGTITHLKDLYGQGFTVQLKVNVAEMELVKREFIAKFAPCTLKDEHSGFLHFHLKNPTLTWSYLFSNMEKLKDRLHGDLEDYVIAGTTLEEVFLSFAKADSK